MLTPGPTLSISVEKHNYLKLLAICIKYILYCVLDPHKHDISVQYNKMRNVYAVEV